ncbi:MAG: hypothetical protein Aurels2KO_08880 [Aureliella sp.]
MSILPDMRMSPRIAVLKVRDAQPAKMDTKLNSRAVRIMALAFRAEKKMYRASVTKVIRTRIGHVVAAMC